MAPGRAFFLFSVLSSCSLAVTVIPLTLNLPKPYESAEKPISSSKDLLSKLNPDMAKEYLYYSSYNGNTSGIYASQDSFVRGAIDAGAKHQHLMLRPQDVWLTILKQVTSYMRKHKDDAEVLYQWNNLDGNVTFPLSPMMFNALDVWMQLQFKRRNKTDWLMDWVCPNFPTVLQKGTGIQKSAEEMTANALMMASSTSSREDMAAFPCENGIPSVTLLGTQDEWKTLLGKLQPLEEGAFGSEPRLYALSLRPILSRFVDTFSRPNDPAIRLFWSDIVTITARQKLCYTTDVVTGWIGAFQFWDGAGNPLLSAQATSNETLLLDGITFPWRPTKGLPTALTYAHVCLGDTVKWVPTELLVGMLAKSIKKGVPEDYERAMRMAGFQLPPTVIKSDHSILQTLPAWMLHGGGKVCLPPPNP
jgi:hypothetical protein